MGRDGGLELGQRSRIGRGLAYVLRGQVQPSSAGMVWMTGSGVEAMRFMRFSHACPWMPRRERPLRARSACDRARPGSASQGRACVTERRIAGGCRGAGRLGGEAVAAPACRQRRSSRATPSTPGSTTFARASSVTRRSAWGSERGGSFMGRFVRTAPGRSTGWRPDASPCRKHGPGHRGCTASRGSGPRARRRPRGDARCAAT